MRLILETWRYALHSLPYFIILEDKDSLYFANTLYKGIDNRLGLDYDDTTANKLELLQSFMLSCKYNIWKIKNTIWWNLPKKKAMQNKKS